MTTIDLDAEVPLKGCSYPASYSTEAMREIRLAAYRAGRLAGLEDAAKEVERDDTLEAKDIACDIRRLKDRVHG